MNRKSVTYEEKGKGYSQLPPFFEKYLKLYTDNKKAMDFSRCFRFFWLLPESV